MRGGKTEYAPMKDSDAGAGGKGGGDVEETPPHDLMSTTKVILVTGPLNILLICVPHRGVLLLY